MHGICMRLCDARPPLDLEVLVKALQQELGVCCCSVRICWQRRKTTNGLEELCESEELEVHPQALPVHPLNQAPFGILEEHNRQLAPHGLTLIRPVLFAR